MPVPRGLVLLSNTISPLTIRYPQQPAIVTLFATEPAAMTFKRAIIGFHQDEHDDGMADLYPWRLRFRFECASYLFHGKTK